MALPKLIEMSDVWFYTVTPKISKVILSSPDLVRRLVLV